MFLDGREVIVMSGATSDVNIETGCRNTKEVFDLDNPDTGWQKKNMEDNNICDVTSELAYIDCK